VLKKENVPRESEASELTEWLCKFSPQFTSNFLKETARSNSGTNDNHNLEQSVIWHGPKIIGKPLANSARIIGLLDEHSKSEYDVDVYYSIGFAIATVVVSTLGAMQITRIMTTALHVQRKLLKFAINAVAFTGPILIIPVLIWLAIGTIDNAYGYIGVPALIAALISCIVIAVANGFVVGTKLVKKSRVDYGKRELLSFLILGCVIIPIALMNL